jgi:hypothetical protein
VPAARQQRVYLHIGEPKTATTFIQHVIWGNRARLAEQGVLLPGYSRRDHTRASRDLREAPRAATDPADPWAGEWDVLAQQAMRTRDAAIISDELLVACNARQADRAVRSLLDAELHVIITVRDYAALLPAEWQETIKCRGTTPWEEWLDGVIDAGAAGDRRRKSFFWTVHDTLVALEMWSRQLPPDRVHVITVPRNSSADVLWGRFAEVVGIDSAGIDLRDARANSSLGLPETEFLRRMNEALHEEMPDWYYTRYIKQILAHDVLSARPRRQRLVLPPGPAAWASEQSERLVVSLRDAKYHIAGDLGELLPDPAAGRYVAPADEPAEQLLDVAIHAAAVLADSRYREMYPTPRPRRRLSPRQRVSQLKWMVLNGHRTRRVLRKRSQHQAVRRLRVAIWWVLMRPTRHRQLAAERIEGPPAAWLAGGRPGLTGVDPQLRSGIPSARDGQSLAARRTVSQAGPNAEIPVARAQADPADPDAGPETASAPSGSGSGQGS